MIKKFLQYHPVHKKISSVFDTFFLLRPTMFFAVWIMVIVGIISAEMNMHTSTLWVAEFSWEIFFVFLGLTLLIGSSFILNQIADAKNDQNNQKLFLIDKYISVDKGKTTSRKLLISGGIILIISNWITFIPAICIYFLWGIRYNRALFEWNKIPISSWFINSFVGLLLFIIGWMLGMENFNHARIFPVSNEILFYLAPYLLSFSAVSLLTTLPNVIRNNTENTDHFSNTRVSSVSPLISLLMVSVAFYLGLKHADPLASTATLVSLPFFLYAAIRRLNKDILRAIRYPIFILNFFAIPYYPWLVIPLLFTYYFSKYYYWHRFDLHYPTFLVDND